MPFLDFAYNGTIWQMEYVRKLIHVQRSERTYVLWMNDSMNVKSTYETSKPLQVKYNVNSFTQQYERL